MAETWIVSRPDLLGGKPCIRGTRISVDFLLELLRGGASRQQILAEFPQITEEALVAALECGSYSRLHDKLE
jgi:uncharacterized protein (DUF433 family)